LHPDTLDRLQALWNRVTAIADGWLRSLGLAMTSAVLRAASSQTRSWGHIADRVHPKDFTEKDILAGAARWLKVTANELSGTSYSAERRSAYVEAYVARHDWLSSSGGINSRPRGPADLLLTSPPYADAIDYYRAQRLSLFLLGYDEVEIEALAATEIGARRRRFRDDSRLQWQEELLGALAKQLSYVGGTDPRVAIVLPHREVRPEDDSAAVRDLMHAAGWRTMFEMVRSIREQRARQSWTSIKQELIIVFTRK
jgi:hypothetical protein